jgi:hypothetical protein
MTLKIRFLDFGILGQGLSGVRFCSLVGSWGMTTAEQGGEK